MPLTTRVYDQMLPAADGSLSEANLYRSAAITAPIGEAPHPNLTGQALKLRVSDSAEG